MLEKTDFFGQTRGCITANMTSKTKYYMLEVTIFTNYIDGLSIITKFQNGIRDFGLFLRGINVKQHIFVHSHYI